MNKLRNRTICYEDESVEGYFYRVALVNYVSLNILNGSISPFYKIGVGDLKRVMFGLNENNGHIYHRNSIYFINNSGLQQHNFRPKNYTKFCPLCLLEKPYHRVHWLIAPIILCKKHNVNLLYQCDKCFHKVSYRDVIEDQCANCKKRLSSCLYREIYRKYNESSMIQFDSIRNDEEVWNGLVLTDYYQVLKRIRWFLTYHMSGAIDSMFGDISKAEQLYIACGYTDIRKSIDNIATKKEGF